MSANDTPIWQGRSDAEEGAGPWRWHDVMRPWAADGTADVVVLGFACDEGVRRNQGRIGAAAGPAALRAALANLPLNGLTALGDAGDIGTMPPDAAARPLELLQTQYAEKIAQIMGTGALPVGLGGGHEIAWGSWCGLMAALGSSQGSRRVGIVNFDAHFDLRAGALATSGTPFRQMAEYCAQHQRPFHYLCLGVSRFANTQALFARADALGVQYVVDETLTAQSLPEVRERLQHFLQPLDDLYLTFCLDVLPAAVAPGVSAPAARGVGLDVLEPLLDIALASGKLRVADVAELNPRYDIDQRTARAAARVVARIAQSRR